jgi:hypothetical protein
MRSGADLGGMALRRAVEKTESLQARATPDAALRSRGARARRWL